MVRVWYLSKAMFLTAKSYKIDWWGYFVGPLLGVIPAIVLAWYGSSTWNISSIFGVDGLKGYLGFLLLGIAYWNYVEILWSAIFTLRRYMKNGQFEDIFLSPVKGFEYILGWTVMGLVRVTLESVPLIVIAFLMNILQMTVQSLGLAFAVFVLSILASFGMVFFVFGVTLIFKDGDQLASLIGNMAPFIGGLYFPVTILPGVLQYISYVFPFTWGIDLMRNILLGARSITSVGIEFSILAVLSITYLLVGTLSYKLLVRKARFRGIHGF